VRRASGRRGPRRPHSPRRYPRPSMPFPQTRLRRLRATRALRGLVRETNLAPAGPRLSDVRRPRHRSTRADRGDAGHRSPVDRARGERGPARRPRSGSRRCCCSDFRRPRMRRALARGMRRAWCKLATRAIKDAHPELIVITDLCLCEYTSHGHCGVIGTDGSVDNDATLELLARTAVSQAHAGADIIAPSDMMDGRVGVIRAALGRRWPDRYADPRVLGEVRVGLLRTVPRGRRLDAGVRRPALLPDGSRQRRRGAARGAARRRGGRRHGDGQARPAVPGRDPPRQG